MSQSKTQVQAQNAPEEKRFKIKPGDKAWVAHETECYRLVTVKEQVLDEYTVFDEEYKSSKVKEGEIWPVNPPESEGVPDNTSLTFLHDPSLLHNLRIRYKRDEIYTFTAYILIAVNPYKRLGIYDDSIIRSYFSKSIGLLPPHVYAIADRAYRNMRNTSKNQSVVISGESGAGKTENAKFVMRFLTLVASSSNSENSKLDNLENKILESNPILEAFGNAKTLRNNNSSRFGKYTQLHFNGNSHVVGASIVTYLLEKSRLIGQAKGERNFHIFYQLLAGATDQEKKDWKINKAEDFSYLNQSECTTVENVDDKQDFDNMRKFLAAVGINGETQTKLFRVLAGLLHLGNVHFSIAADKEKEKKSKKDEGNVDDKVQVSEDTLKFLETAAAMFGIPKEQLQDRLVNRTLTAGTKSKSENTFTIRLNEQEATYARDAFAKYIYGHVFDWLVATINKNIPRGDSKNYIGILDISGFELFENNSFEQFSINFANERIQQYFNHQILSQEQEIYLLEGLQWRKVDYVDNQEVINLVDSKRTGIFDLLDEECIMPKGSDKSFTAKIHTTHSANDHLDIPKYNKKTKGKRLNKDEGFVIKHFAGSVLYNSHGFLDKNNDTIHQDLLDLLFVSSEPYFKSMFPQNESDDDIPTANRRFKSVSARFREQLNSLMTDLYSTTSHFIRCIKPNELQKPGIFENNNVMQQLRYNGMCTALELMQAGFPTRISFDELYARYSPLMPEAFSKLKPITFCEAILVALDLHGGRDFQMGLTKVFFRAGKLQFLDELTNNSKDSMGAIVGKVKKWLAKKRFRGAIAAVKSLNRFNKQILTIRAMYKLREAGKFALKMSRLWVPFVAKSRQSLLASEEYKRRMEEEAKRKEEARLAAIRKQEEEERARREKKEARKRAREEAKKLLEEQRNRAEEQRTHAELHAKDLNQKLKLVEDEKESALQKNQQLELSVRQLEERVEGLKSTAVKQESEMEQMITKLKAQIYELESKLVTEQNSVKQFDRKNQELDQELKAEQQKLKDTEEKLNSQREVTAKGEEQIASLNKSLEEVTDSYKQEQQLANSLRQDLSDERTHRLEDNRKAALLLEQTQAKGQADLANKQGEFDSLFQSKKQLEQEMQKQKESLTQQNNDLQAKLNAMTQDRDHWKSKFEELEGRHQEALKKIDTYEKEREKLIQTALNAQSDQRKLRQIIDKFEKQPEGYLKLLYGDLTFSNLLKEAIKHGEVTKQGGDNKAKWQKRHIILIEGFLLYYATTQDKEPRGIIRIDQEHTASSKADLKKFKIDHSFTIQRLDKTARAYFFSCPNEEELTQWLRELLLMQRWTETEVETYLEANFKNMHTLRSIKGRLVID